MTTALAFRTSTTTSPTTILTNRELTVLGLRAAGNSHEEVAVKLSLPRGTVSSISSRILTKLGARNMAHAVHLAHDADLIHRSPQASDPTALDALHSLIANGYTNQVIAAAIGVGEWTLSRVLHGTAWLTPQLEARVLRTFLSFYGQTPEDHGIPQKSISRARNAANANGWMQLDLAEVRLITRRAGNRT